MLCVEKSWINFQFILFNMWNHEADFLETNDVTPCLLRALCIIPCLTPPFDLVSSQKDIANLSCFGRSGVCYCVWWKDNQRVAILHLSVVICCLYVLSVSLRACCAKVVKVIPCFPDSGAKFKSIKNPCEISETDFLGFFHQELSFLLVLKQYILTDYSVGQIWLSGTVSEAHCRFWIWYLIWHVAGINMEVN